MSGYPPNYPPGYPPAYPQQQPPIIVQNYVPPVQSSSMATISLVSAILGWFLLPLIGPLIAIFTGHIAKAEINASQGRMTGGGMATAGLILGYLQMVLWVIGCCSLFAYFVFIAAAASQSGSY